MTADSSIPGLDDLDPLEALFQESIAASREAQAAKDARERVKRGGLTSAEQAADAERIRRWELAHEWKPVANVALFERHRCACGRQRTIFRQLMQRQEHRHMHGAMRWQQVESSRLDLPSEVAVQKWESPMCPDCISGHGYSFEQGKVTEWQG